MSRKLLHNYCQCCGQIIPPRLVFENAPVRQRIFDYIASHPEGVTFSQIVNSVYAADIDGGPESCSVLSVHLNKMKPMLRERGLTIRAGGRRGGKYKLLSILGELREAAE